MALEWVIPKGNFKTKKEYIKACSKIKGMYHFLTWELYKIKYL